MPTMQMSTEKVARATRSMIVEKMHHAVFGGLFLDITQPEKQAGQEDASQQYHAHPPFGPNGLKGKINPQKDR